MSWTWLDHDGNSHEIQEPNSDIEALHKEFLKTRNHNGRVFHCFGDGMSTGIDFATMKTFCYSKHRCETEDQNEFHLVRKNDVKK